MLCCTEYSCLIFSWALLIAILALSLNKGNLCTIIITLSNNVFLLRTSPSRGNLAVLPYIKKYGVIFVLFCRLVLYAINVGFTNLSQSYTSSSLDNASPSVLLNRSIIPFTCGLYGLTVWCHI